jgi:hypothetical protein
MQPIAVADATGLEEAAPARTGLRLVLFAAVGTRLMVVACMLAGTYFTREGYRFWSGTAEGQRWAYVPIRWLDAFGRWDTWFYLRIASFGYQPVAQGWAHEAAFFPLYPMLIRGVSELTALPLFFSALLVSWVCFALAVRSLYRLFEEVAGERTAAWATAALLMFPGSLFLTTAYTESLFLLLSTTAIRFARQRAFGLAGVAAALAALTRPNGVLLVVALGIELWRAWRRRERLGWAWGCVLLPVAALALHAGLMAQVYDNPLYFQVIQRAWGRSLSPPWVALFGFHFDPDYYLFTLGALAAIVWAWRRGSQPLSLQAHAAVSILLPLCTGTMKSMPRFVGVDFPLFLTLAEWTRTRRRRLAYAGVALAFLAVYAFRYARADAIN